jgi:hypothetical protein
MRLAWLLLPLAACGSGDDEPAPVGPCSPQVSFYGELFDLDAIGGDFAGVGGAVLTVDGGDPTTTTPPNGRVELCVDRGRTRVAVDAPGDYLDGSYVAEASLFADASTFLQYAATSAQLTTLYATFGGGLVPDPTRAQLLVEVRGRAATVALAGAQAAAVRHFSGAAWNSDGPGAYALFINVAPGTGTVSAPGADGGGAVPLTAGGWTMTTIDMP